MFVLKDITHLEDLHSGHSGGPGGSVEAEGGIQVPEAEGGNEAVLALVSSEAELTTGVCR